MGDVRHDDADLVADIDPDGGPGTTLLQVQASKNLPGVSSIPIDDRGAFAAAGQVAATRNEESKGYVDHLVVRPVARWRWPAGWWSPHSPPGRESRIDGSLPPVPG